MKAFQFAEDRVDVQNPRFGELFFGADDFFRREFDTDFVFGIDIRFEVSPREVPELAHVRWHRIWGDVATDEGFVFGGTGRQRNRERNSYGERQARKHLSHGDHHIKKRSNNLKLPYLFKDC